MNDTNNVAEPTSTYYGFQFRIIGNGYAYRVQWRDVSNPLPTPTRLDQFVNWFCGVSSPTEHPWNDMRDPELNKVREFQNLGEARKAVVEARRQIDIYNEPWRVIEAV